MLKSFDTVLGRLRKRGEKVEEVMCVLSAPWYVSQTRTIVFEQEKPFLVTEKKVDVLVEKEIVELKKEFDAHYKDITKSSAEIIEIENVHMKLNGYETSAPFGKEVQSLEAFLYVSMSSEHILKDLRTRAKNSLSVKKVSFHSFSLVAFSTLRDIYSNIHDFMFIDISGEMTDVAVVRKNTLIETLTFPLGTNFVLRTIASHLGTIPEEAQSFLALYEDHKIVEESEKKMRSALLHSEQEWMDAFKKDLRSLSTYTVLPRKIFIYHRHSFHNLVFTYYRRGGLQKLAPYGREA